MLDNLGLSLQDLQQIVESDNKGRFEFSEDKSLVRALYGLSIDVNLGLEPTTPPLVLYHGTVHWTRLPKWLLLQMVQMRITCSEKKVKNHLLFFYYNTL